MGNITFKLAPDEREEVEKKLNGQGGYQTLLSEMQNQLESDNSLTIDDQQLGRIVRMMSHYGSGGFQGRLRRAFANHVRALVEW